MSASSTTPAKNPGHSWLRVPFVSQGVSLTSVRNYGVTLVVASFLLNTAVLQDGNETPGSNELWVRDQKQEEYISKHQAI